MKIAIGSDHAGFELKNKIISKFKDKIEFIDCGTNSIDSVDYPDYAKKVCKVILDKQTELGILICGTGVGISIAANKHKGIRAGLCFNSYMAKLIRQHNNANILCLGGRTTGEEIAYECVNAFVNTEFEGGRHQRRLDKVKEIENSN